MKGTDTGITIATVVLLILLASVTGYRQPLVKKGNPAGNDCPKTAPWPCKSGQCLAFSFICDGRSDCIDGYDEDSALCTAKDRPASVILAGFIQRFHNWLIPGVLGEGTPNELAKLLTEEPNVRDYAAKVHLTSEQTEKLILTLEYAKDGRVIDLILDGMPEEAYREAYALFGRLVQSGFLGNSNQ
ncbi:hypothetical protein BOX15_Mlig030944g1 [Macrostomum lignano]|uniref:Prohormone-4 n=1 Tax=Macrostomum lignano TaxID=282301 RepID=A0A267FCS9_9PLAT|nr:hypothetical protein BOX15_Mlig030944g1 [Macrostomum lignano]